MIGINHTLAAKILLVEDEPDMAQLVHNWLTHQQHTVDIVDNGSKALSYLKTYINKYEVIILDVMLPGQSGIEVCQLYRDQAGTAPILMLTARDAIEDKEMAFKAGADDYLTKPFHLKELSARVNALLRRSKGITSECYAVYDIQIYFAERKIFKAGKIVHLTPKEFQLLQFFISYPKRIFSSEELLKTVWGINSKNTADTDTVRGHINRLRRKLDTFGKPSLIDSVYGQGYRFEPPVES